ncbi:MAG: Ig-like domain-containing protein, partial [Bacteroidota bacterium]
MQGYFLKLGEAGSADAIKFCRDNGSGSISELASGTASLINSSFTIRLKVIRNESGQWTVLAAPGGGNNFQTELTVTDATYTSSTHLGVVCLYTSSNADQFFFDDFYFGDIVVDATPPNVLQVAVPTSTSLHVTFSESVQASGAEQVSNYTVPGIGAPLSAALDGPAAALLTFAAPFPSNEPQVLEVSNIADLADNTMLPSSHPFTWLELSPGAYRSVVFNEVLADPTPSIQLPEAEFVELHNPTS